jgi:hypothetical protein
MTAENTRNFYRNQGMQTERERIIKLLESYAKSCANDKCECLSAESTIELIKGRTNAGNN